MFTTSSNLKQHLDTHVFLEISLGTGINEFLKEKKSLKCEICGREYQNFQSYRKHLKTHKVDGHNEEENIEEEEHDEEIEVPFNKSKVLIERKSSYSKYSGGSPKRGAEIEYHYEINKQLKTEYIESGVQEYQEKESSCFTLKIEDLGTSCCQPIMQEEKKICSSNSNEGKKSCCKKTKCPSNNPNTITNKENEGFNPSECLLIRHQDHNDYLFKGKLMHQKPNGEWEEHELEASEQNPSVCKPLREMSHIPNFSSLTAKYDQLIKQTDGLTQDILNKSCNVLLCGGCQNPEKESKGGCGSGSGAGGCCCAEKKESEAKDSCCTSTTDPGPKKAGGCCSSKTEEKPAKAEKEGCCGGRKGSGEGAGKATSSCCGVKAEGEKGCCSGGCGCSSSTRETNLSECADVKIFSSCLCSATQSFKHRHSEICGHPIIYHDGHVDYIVGNQLHHVHDGHCDDHGIIFIIKESGGRLNEDLELELAY